MRILILSKLDLSGALNVNRLVHSLHGKHELYILLSDLVLEVERSGRLTNYCMWHDRDFMVDEFFPFLDAAGVSNARFQTFAELSRRYDIPITLLRDADHDEVLLSAAQTLQPDLVYCCRFDYILRGPFLDTLPRPPINTHSGLLPQLCGPNATFWAMFKNMQYNACSLHRITPMIDGGPLIAQPPHTLDYRRSFFWNRNQVYKQGIKAFLTLLPGIEHGHPLAEFEQDHSQRVYYSLPDENALEAFMQAKKSLYAARDVHTALRGFLPNDAGSGTPAQPHSSLAAWMEASLQKAGLDTVENRYQPVEKRAVEPTKVGDRKNATSGS